MPLSCQVLNVSVGLMKLALEAVIAESAYAGRDVPRATIVDCGAEGATSLC